LSIEKILRKVSKTANGGYQLVVPATFAKKLKIDYSDTLILELHHDHIALKKLEF